MKGLLKFIGLIIILGAIGSVFNGGKKSKKTPSKKVTSSQKQTVSPEVEKSEKLKLAASRLRNGGSIKAATLIGDKALITYVKNYKEYKELNPRSSVTEGLLDSYWDTGEAVKKALNDGAVRLIKDLDFVNASKITLPVKGKTYTIEVSKSEIESFTNVSFNNLVTNWDEKFINKYVYDKNGRESFFKKFGNIKN